MNCCACMGSCNHIGNHQFCDAHKPSTGPQMAPMFFPPFTEKACAHCYCTEEAHGGKPHVRCCNCGNRQLKMKVTY